MIDATRFARLVTDVVVRRPALWRVFRAPFRSMFDGLAPTWEKRIGPHHLWALDLALADVPVPRRVLDVGTGTGIVAQALAERYPEADVIGIDVSPAMVDAARRRLPPELVDRIEYEIIDASRVPCADGFFNLVALSNMIPFFDELARLTASGGTLVVSYSRGSETPIYVSAERLRRELGRRGFAEFADFSQPPATALRATRR